MFVSEASWKNKQRKINLETVLKKNLKELNWKIVSKTFHLLWKKSNNVFLSDPLLWKFCCRSSIRFTFQASRKTCACFHCHSPAWPGGPALTPCTVTGQTWGPFSRTAPRSSPRICRPPPGVARYRNVGRWCGGWRSGSYPRQTHLEIHKHCLCIKQSLCNWKNKP